MKSIGTFLIGIILGIILGFWGGERPSKMPNYIKLKEDFCVDGTGFLKEGCILRFDQAYSEGFSRYILYLNLPSSYDSEKYPTERRDEIIPYWLQAKDSICSED